MGRRKRQPPIDKSVDWVLAFTTCSQALMVANPTIMWKKLGQEVWALAIVNASSLSSTSTSAVSVPQKRKSISTLIVISGMKATFALSRPASSIMLVATAKALYKGPLYAMPKLRAPLGHRDFKLLGHR